MRATRKLFAVVFSYFFVAQISYADFMSFESFKKLAAEIKSKDIRCTDTKSELCKKQLDYALKHEIIDAQTHRWAIENDYYPLMDIDNTIRDVCTCGCFEKNTRLFVLEKDRAETKELAIIDLYVNKETFQPLAITKDWTQDATYEIFPRDVDRFTKGKESKQLYVFHLENGRLLKLTSRHGVVLGDGRMVSAESVKLGDTFMSHSGHKVEIRKITRERTYDDVYNFLLKEPEALGTNVSDPHVIVAEGVLVGDLIWQNSREAELGSILIRESKLESQSN